LVASNWHLCHDREPESNNEMGCEVPRLYHQSGSPLISHPVIKYGYFL
jgi:hypothetical protein